MSGNKQHDVLNGGHGCDIHKIGLLQRVSLLAGQQGHKHLAADACMLSLWRRLDVADWAGRSLQAVEAAQSSPAARHLLLPGRPQPGQPLKGRLRQPWKLALLLLLLLRLGLRDRMPTKAGALFGLRAQHVQGGVLCGQRERVKAARTYAALQGHLLAVLGRWQRV
jgi:hypothetical protein